MNGFQDFIEFHKDFTNKQIEIGLEVLPKLLEMFVGDRRAYRNDVFRTYEYRVFMPEEGSSFKATERRVWVMNDQELWLNFHFERERDQKRTEAGLSISPNGKINLYWWADREGPAIESIANQYDGISDKFWKTLKIIEREERY